MHIVPAPAESLMKSRVLSIPGLQGVMDKDGYWLFRLSAGVPGKEGTCSGSRFTRGIAFSFTWCGCGARSVRASTTRHQREF